MNKRAQPLTLNEKGEYIDFKPSKDVALGREGSGSNTDWTKLLLGGGSGLLAYNAVASLMDKSDDEKRKESIWNRVLRILAPIGAGVAGAYGGWKLGDNIKSAASGDRTIDDWYSDYGITPVGWRDINGNIQTYQNLIDADARDSWWPWVGVGAGTVGGLGSAAQAIRYLIDRGRYDANVKNKKFSTSKAQDLYDLEHNAIEEYGPRKSAYENDFGQAVEGAQKVRQYNNAKRRLIGQQKATYPNSKAYNDLAKKIADLDVNKPTYTRPKKLEPFSSPVEYEGSRWFKPWSWGSEPSFDFIRTSKPNSKWNNPLTWGKVYKPTSGNIVNKVNKGAKGLLKEEAGKKGLLASLLGLGAYLEYDRAMDNSAARENLNKRFDEFHGYRDPRTGKEVMTGNEVRKIVENMSHETRRKFFEDAERANNRANRNKPN